MSTEPWLQGPVEGVPAGLQPAAHALLNARADLRGLAAQGPTDAELRARPGGAPPVGFHLVHLTGALDRLLTYAAGDALSADQKAALALETDTAAQDALTVDEVIERVERAIETALLRLRATDPAMLGDARGVGRAQLPSTVAGLLFHAGEHSARHAGQALTTFRIVRGLGEG